MATRSVADEFFYDHRTPGMPSQWALFLEESKAALSERPRKEYVYSVTPEQLKERRESRQRRLEQLRRAWDSKTDPNEGAFDMPIRNPAPSDLSNKCYAVQKKLQSLELTEDERNAAAAARIKFSQVTGGGTGHGRSSEVKDFLN